MSIAFLFVFFMFCWKSDSRDGAGGGKGERQCVLMANNVNGAATGGEAAAGGMETMVIPPTPPPPLQGQVIISKFCLAKFHTTNTTAQTVFEIRFQP